MKKNLFLLMIVFMLSANIAFPANKSEEASFSKENLEVVTLEPDLIEEEESYNVPEAISVSVLESKAQGKEKTLREKLQDVYNLEIDKYDKHSYLLEDIFTHKFDESSLMDYTHFWAGYNGSLGVNFDDGSVTNHYDFNAITASLDGVLKNDVADFRSMIRIMPNSHRNVMQTIFSDTYIGTNKIPHHRVQVGYFRPKVGHEGTLSTYIIPFLTRAQISREFGTVRKIGAKIEGNYSFIEYNLGLYSSGTYFQQFFPGAEFDGWVYLKPLAKTNGKYGTLKVGGGLQGGHRGTDYCVTGVYAGWEYKRFFANFEWANANGYNGNSGNVTTRRADGFYATAGYMLTKKLQLLARYDQFDSDKHVAKNTNREYSVGLNYFIKGQALKLMLNYVFCQNRMAGNSHRIVIGTQIIL